jgi:hypothetical protein
MDRRQRAGDRSSSPRKEAVMSKARLKKRLMPWIQEDGMEIDGLLICAVVSLMLISPFRVQFSVVRIQ